MMSAIIKRGRALINAQALIGKVLGNCTIQKLIGQGGMSAVFLAQQSSPQRQVAVKVLAIATTQTPDQKTDFLEGFHQEVAAISSLEHQNILPVYEYGEHDGLAYLVMPYIEGGTLRTVLEQDGQLALSKIANYLDQLASALDFAHERGILHRNMQPANVFKTSEDHLLLADLGLMKVMAERPTSQMRLLKSGVPVKALEYMAPEQVMGDVVDARADLYALGVILYQMVTGKTPFEGGTAMQIARQLVQVSPPSPRGLRPEVPVAAEQVMLRALAKRPADRYAHAKDFASAFRVALTAAGTLTESSLQMKPATNEVTTHNVPLATRSRGLFDPVWQKAEGKEVPTEEAGENGQSKNGLKNALPTTPNTPDTENISVAPLRPRLRVKTGLLRPVDKKEVPDPISPFPTTNVTGALIVPNSELGKTGTSNTMKLASSVKVVQVPVAGQPGRYVTGFLPVLPSTQQTPQPQPVESPEPFDVVSEDVKKNTTKKWQKILLLALVVLLIISIPGSYLFIHARSGQDVSPKSGVHAEPLTPDASVIGAAQATATANANVILFDPLNQNIHNWPVSGNGPILYMFKDGAYHIVNNDTKKSAPAFLGGVNIKGSFAYSLTMEEIKGDDSSINNSFGMIFRFSSEVKGKSSIVRFYTFQVVNSWGSEYRFAKYDDSKGPSVDPWSTIWHFPFGREFHQGQGSKHINTFKVVVNSKTFTFIVNGKKVGTVQDGSLTSGEVGMLVNQKGTEVAFSNLELTYS